MSGGWNNEELKSVEAYDYYKNRWSYFPNMIEKRRYHASVGMSNKLFVIGGYRTLTCEMFDNYSREFCYIKTSLEFGKNMSCFEAVSISNQIILFGDVYGEYETKVITYNVETSEWKFIDCKYLNNKSGFSCIKYHP